MRGFPVETLMENPHFCLFHFFKRGIVIVNDSNQSDWLYIVKSGSCQVMKELKGVKASKQTDLTKSIDDVTVNKQNGGVRFPAIAAGAPTSRIDAGQVRGKPARVVTSALRRAIEEYDDYLDQQVN